MLHLEAAARLSKYDNRGTTMLEEFKKFALRGNVVDLAVAISACTRVAYQHCRQLRIVSTTWHRPESVDRHQRLAAPTVDAVSVARI